MMMVVVVLLVVVTMVMTKSMITNSDEGDEDFSWISWKLTTMGQVLG